MVICQGVVGFGESLPNINDKDTLVSDIENTIKDTTSTSADSLNNLSSPTIGDNLKPLIILKELHPKYFVATDYEVSALVVDDGEIEKVILQYKVNNEGWKSIEMQKETTILDDFKKILDKFLTPPGNYGVYKAKIPSQSPGSEVWYKVVAYDKSGKSWESIMGYYIVPNLNGKKVLIYDPSMEAYFLKENLKRFKEMSKQYELYKYSQTVTINNLTKRAELFDKYDKYVIPKHNWNVLAKTYNIIIVTSPKEVKDLLNVFKPKVVVISNTWLYPWELSNSTQEKLIKYLRDVNGGLVVTHGGIYDQVIYKSPNKKYKVGVIDHVGYDLGDYTIDKTKLSLALGLDLAPATEYIKFLTADTLYQYDEYREIAYIIGSTPLFVPYIPFSGNMKILNNHPILAGISKEFQINIPSAYEECGFKGYTLVGWQFYMPSEIARNAENAGEKAKERGKDVLEKIKEFEKEFVGKSYNENLKISYAIYGGIKVNEKEINMNISGEINGKKIEPITIDKKDEEFNKLMEKVRLLKEFGSIFLAKTIAISDDNLAGIVVNDESYRKDGIRTVYFSFEVEAGEDENSKKLLKNAVEWASNFKYNPPLREVIVLSNDVDWNIKGKELEIDLEKADFKVRRVNAKEFENYKKERLIIILGGPDAYDGVGKYVREALTEEECNDARTGKRVIFIKHDVWAKPQIVIIIAGKDRYSTGDRINKYLKDMDTEYQNLLKEVISIQ